MGDIDLKAIREACEAATPGPWKVAAYVAGDAREVAQVDAPGYCVADCYESERPGQDAAFIAGARSWVPQLVDRVAALENCHEELVRDFARWHTELASTYYECHGKTDAELASCQGRIAELEADLAQAEEVRAAAITIGAAAARRANTLEAALRRYGRHDGRCPKDGRALHPHERAGLTFVCTCGLDAALSPAPTTETQDTGRGE